MTVLERDHELVATLPGGTNEIFFRSCVEAGMDRARIHTAKTSEADAAKLILICEKFGIGCSLDFPGKKGRVLKSQGMIQVQNGLEKGNWLIELTPGQEMILVTEGFSSDRGIFACQLTCLPQVFKGDGTETINFADGKIACDVKEVTRVDGTTAEILVKVKSIHDTEGLFWKMGINSDTTDIFSGDDPVLTTTDINKLKTIKALLGDHNPSEIALSFVSTGKQVRQAQETIKGLGIASSTLAKIETVRGVKNIDEIVDLTDVEVARGDLEESIKVDGTMTLQEAETLIVQAANRAGRKVIIATHVADSLWKKVKDGQNIEGQGLSRPERVAVCVEYPTSNGFMLAAETMTTGENARDVIKSANKSIQVAKRYWQIYGGLGR